MFSVVSHCLSIGLSVCSSVHLSVCLSANHRVGGEQGRAPWVCGGSSGSVILPVRL